MTIQETAIKKDNELLLFHAKIMFLLTFFLLSAFCGRYLVSWRFMWFISESVDRKKSEITNKMSPQSTWRKQNDKWSTSDKINFAPRHNLFFSAVGEEDTQTGKICSRAGLFLNSNLESSIDDIENIGIKFPIRTLVPMMTSAWCSSPSPCNCIDCIKPTRNLFRGRRQHRGMNKTGAHRTWRAHFGWRCIAMMLCGLQYPSAADLWFASRKPAVDEVGNPSSVNAR